MFGIKGGLRVARGREIDRGRSPVQTSQYRKMKIAVGAVARRPWVGRVDFPSMTTSFLVALFSFYFITYISFVASCNHYYFSAYYYYE